MENFLFGPSLVGTRADVLMDIVIASIVLIVPAALWSIHQARTGGYTRHRNTQVSLALILAVVVALFEWDLRLKGGFRQMAAGGRYAGSALLFWSLNIHLVFSSLASLVWIGLIVASLRNFGSPPKPGAFSPRHRYWGRAGVILMALAAVTGLELYLVAFVI